MRRGKVLLGRRKECCFLSCLQTCFVEGPFTLLAVESTRPIAYVFLCPNCYQRRPAASGDPLRGLEPTGELSGSSAVEPGFSGTADAWRISGAAGSDTSRGMERRLPHSALASVSFVLSSEVGAALRCLQLREWDLVCLPFFVWRQLPTSEERRGFLLSQRALCLAFQNCKPELNS